MNLTLYSNQSSINGIKQSNILISQKKSLKTSIVGSFIPHVREGPHALRLSGNTLMRLIFDRCTGKVHFQPHNTLDFPIFLGRSCMHMHSLLCDVSPFPRPREPGEKYAKREDDVDKLSVSLRDD